MFGGLNELQGHLGDQRWARDTIRQGIGSRARLRLVGEVSSSSTLDNDWEAWLRAGDPTNSFWAPYDDYRYRARISDRSVSVWQPGPMGVQGTNIINRVHLAESIFGALPYRNRIFGNSIPFQQDYAHVRRDLDWVEEGLWNTYTGLESTQAFITHLYTLIPHPKGGGWRNSYYWVPKEPIREIPNP